MTDEHVIGEEEVQIIKPKVRTRKYADDAVRDYIPDDAELTPAERGAVAAGRARLANGAVPGFIPGPGHVLKPPSGAKNQADDALNRALAEQNTAARREYNEVQEHLRVLNVTNAVKYISMLPYNTRNLYLCIERENGNRKSILDRFGAPDQAVIDRYRALMAAEDSSSDKESVANKEK